MSVSKNDRDLSDAEFLFQIFELNKLVGRIMENKPKKYKNTYSDYIIYTALDALKEARLANDRSYREYDDTINEENYRYRREHFLIAKTYIKTVSTVSHIFLEIVRASNQYESTKLYKQETQIGDQCGACMDLLDGIMKSDERRLKAIY